MTLVDKIFKLGSTLIICIAVFFLVENNWAKAAALLVFAFVVGMEIWGLFDRLKTKKYLKSVIEDVEKKRKEYWKKKDEIKLSLSKARLRKGESTSFINERIMTEIIELAEYSLTGVFSLKEADLKRSAAALATLHAELQKAYKVMERL